MRNMSYPVDSKQVGAFKAAIEAGGDVALWPEQYAAYIETLAWFVGGPLDSVDAFVARVQVAGGLPDQIFTLWLKGNSIGLLGVTPEPPEQNTPKISGWIRPVASVARLSLEAADIYRALFMNVTEEVRPTIRIHFNDGETVEFSAAKCFSELAREQVFNFVDRLRGAIAELGSRPDSPRRAEIVQ